MNKSPSSLLVYSGLVLRESQTPGHLHPTTQQPTAAGPSRTIIFQALNHLHQGFPDCPIFIHPTKRQPSHHYKIKPVAARSLVSLRIECHTRRLRGISPTKLPNLWSLCLPAWYHRCARTALRISVVICTIVGVAGLFWAERGIGIVPKDG